MVRSGKRSLALAQQAEAVDNKMYSGQQSAKGRPVRGRERELQEGEDDGTIQITDCKKFDELDERG